MRLESDLERKKDPRTHTLIETEDNDTLTSFPDRIFIELFPSTHKGYVYTKDYEHENGGCYYRSKENDNPVTGAFVSLYPDGHLTYLWDGTEHPLRRDWHEA